MAIFSHNFRISSFTSRWSYEPIEVLPFFSPTMNQIVFPYGILHPPFFDVSFPNAINFGSIGAIFSHELEHSFEALFDQDQVFGQRLLNNTYIHHFEMKRSNCFIQQYSNYTTKEHNIDGKLTLCNYYFVISGDINLSIFNFISSFRV